MMGIFDMQTRLGSVNLASSAQMESASELINPPRCPARATPPSALLARAAAAFSLHVGDEEEQWSAFL